MAIPKNLKIGDTFTENDFKGPLLYKVIGFDGAGNYISEYIGRAEEKAVVFENPSVVEEKAPVEEAKPEKKPATRKAPAKRKRTPAKKA